MSPAWQDAAAIELIEEGLAKVDYPALDRAVAMVGASLGLDSPEFAAFVNAQTVVKWTALVLRHRKKA